MQDIFYKLGYCAVFALPVGLALLCISKIRKNRAEIKKMEEENSNKTRR